MPDTTTSLILPESESVKKELKTINEFQSIVHMALKEGLDYGTIPGTKRPTLLKPGAEKIVKLLGLCDTYDILQQVEEWNKPFFYYQVRCNLTTVSGVLIGQGLGSCNSMESKYRYRWLWPDEAKAVPGFNEARWPKKTINAKGHKVHQYRFDNDEIYSQVNTILKISKKRAMVDAALSAGRLSELFTQDIEDMADITEVEYTVVNEKKEEKEHFCSIHGVPFKKHEKEGETWYSHKIEDTGKYCTEGKTAEMPAAAPPPAPPTPPEEPIPAPPANPEDEKYHFSWLHKALKTLRWEEPSMVNYLDNCYHCGRGESMENTIKKLTTEQMKAFYKEVNSKRPK